MHYDHLHDWPRTVDEAVALQLTLAGQVDVTRPLAGLRLVAGCDIAYDISSPALHAAVAVIEVPSGAVIESVVVSGEATFPYVPGLLSFREVPPLLAAFSRLRSEPAVIMLDGQGVAHPRRFGLACHLGLWLGRPTLGCAKSWLVGEYADPGPAAGDTSPLSIDSDVVGAVVRSAAGAKPVYVSPGHRVDVPGAVAVVRATLSGYRHPTPTRAAHLLANDARAKAGRTA
jgi:deoxyribonuclease V